MVINLGKKLIAIVDKQHVKFFEAEGIKITSKKSEIKLDIEKHKTQSKHQGSYHKNSEMGGFYDPHTDPKELEGRDSAKNILNHIEEILKEHEYSEVILASSPKMLGYLRQSMKGNIKNKITKQIDKDLIHSDIEAIEKKVFAA
jgi:protein required for attachment to host cells